MLGRDLRRVDAELRDEKAPEVGPLLDLFVRRLAGTVSSFGVDPDQDWRCAALRMLQSGREFVTV